MIPGWCEGDLQPLASAVPVPVEAGPRDLRRLPETFGGVAEKTPLEDWSIEIIAEINFAPRLPIDEIVRLADDLRRDGADMIDLGCLPGSVWRESGVAVRELVDRGHRVSIDSLEPAEIGPAARAGAELVLSVNSGNRAAATEWGCEVVVIPDRPDQWLEMADTVAFLADRKVPLRIDPVLEPIGVGFAASLNRYWEARRIWPDAPMMMGIGNLTELTEVDSAGVNFLLLAICEELGIGSILTTQVGNWSRTSVRECDLARRLVHAAQALGTPPVKMDPRMVCLRDPKTVRPPAEELAELAAQIRDNNCRVATSQDALHLMAGGEHWFGADAFDLFSRLLESDLVNMDASHAFYLGYEMCKATIALQLGKQYEQDEALRWGYLTQEETRHRLRRSRTGKNRKENP
jgi:dihydropteroate synthase-like protein